MTKVTKEATFDAAHRLYKYDGLCRFLHGHTYKVQVTVRGAVDSETGMVMDFKQLSHFIDSTISLWDHAVILNKEDPLVPLLQSDNKVILCEGNPTAECMAEALRRALHGLNVCSVKIWETPTSFAEWTDEE